MHLIEFFNKTFDLSVGYAIGYSYKTIALGVFITINDLGLILDTVRPITIKLTNYYKPTKNRITVLAELLDIVNAKW